LAFLSPADDSVDIPTTVPKALTKPSRPAKVLGSAKPRKAQRKPRTTAQHKALGPPRGYAELPRDQEFGPPRQGRFFGLFLRRRLSADEFSTFPCRERVCHGGHLAQTARKCCSEKCSSLTGN